MPVSDHRGPVAGRRLAILLAFSFAVLTACGNEPTRQHIVEIQGFQFVPSELVVNQGDTITWINRDIAPHTATSTDASWDTGTLLQGESKTLIISEAFQPDYLCAFHVNMKGRILTSTVPR